ncbi:hypothetical protein COY90_00450 [Candidatus Roizmanbacteria bacterium CG_4_10_14_0_8_um_filter_39_9]|uniref:HPt domain-containing protein n=1 Tax=Candidatus Roizmanbacteria bacterium CG_4_10_14_0_8_um_filter_39_9 TaxID=1974829 RepID=A0A2M7QF36_9BACT|nr:MAG: hypothetical protein COY90_00450 [Candidatus Roizmanbacteria bacterium CG_4_10_14_0_8_um_filter_39_9]
MGVNLSEYKSLFIQTAVALVQLYDQSLLILKKDISNKTEIEKLFRTIHSLKSQSLFMNYVRMGEYCIKLEAFLYPFKNGSTYLTGDILSALPDKSLFLTNLKSIENTDSEVVFGELKLPVVENST